MQDADGSVFEVDQLLVQLTAELSWQDIQATADFVGGTVVGGFPLINLYEFHVPSSTAATLRTIAQTVSTLPGVVTAYPDYFVLFASQNDLLHLDSCLVQTFTVAYDKISLQQAYALIAAQGRIPQSVHIGIVDSGITSHWEFDGVNVVIDPLNTGQDRVGHGTAVAGVIGANNLGAALTSCNQSQSDPLHSAYQMNWYRSGRSGHFSALRATCFGGRFDSG